MKKVFKTLILLSFIAAIPLVGHSQCKGFTKQKCLPELTPYIYNGQLNSAILNEGDVAELLLTLYGGQDYRIYICSQDNLGKLGFVLLDTDRNPIFDNKTQGDINHWDFTANSTQQLIVQVKIPEDLSVKESTAVNSGCVSILIGFKE